MSQLLWQIEFIAIGVALVAGITLIVLRKIRLYKAIDRAYERAQEIEYVTSCGHPLDYPFPNKTIYRTECGYETEDRFLHGRICPHCGKTMNFKGKEPRTASHNYIKKLYTTGV
jgi:predicted RNA-binding Zn-ribbon protein involved in translation (DUF1610 family)